MILDRDLIFYDDFNDCHDEIVVAGVDFIGRRLICGLYLQGRGASRSPNEDSYSESSISSSMVVERKPRFQGDESASYVVLNDVIADIFSSIQMSFGLVPKRWILRHIQCFGFGRWIRHKYCTSVPRFEGSH